MAIGNIFKVPVKTDINVSLQSKSIMVVGKSKAGKSTICSQAPRPIFLMTENGGEALTGFVPVAISSWSDFKSAVTQLCTPQGRDQFDTVVIDTYTNLILLLDKYVGAQLSTDKQTYNFGSDAEYGKGTKVIKNELGAQLQKLANQGYLLLNVVHAEDKTDFATGKDYIGTSLTSSVYGVAEKFVDQIIYLRREAPDKNGNIEHRIYFNSKGGFAGTGGRFTPDVDSVRCNFEDLKAALITAMERTAAAQGSGTVTEVNRPSIIIEDSADRYNFTEMVAEFKSLTDEMVQNDPEEGPTAIRMIVEAELGVGKKVAQLTAPQAELLANIIENIKYEMNKGENE